MFRKLIRDRRGNYAMLTALAMLPVMAGVALAVDYSEVSRQRQAAQNALDATNLAISHGYLDGNADTAVRTLAQDYFEANFPPSKTANPNVSVTFPSDNNGGGTLKVCAALDYEPIFYPVVQMMRGDTRDSTIKYTICSEVRLKNTLEVALVLDNSGSMDERGFGSGKKRMDLLKDASKQLVDALAGQAELMQQVDKPVQFGLVPFAASVNVGADKATAAWMDTEGRSSIHHENFEWGTMKDPDKRVELVNGVYRKIGAGWGSSQNRPMTRFELFGDLNKKNSSIRWAGCVEVRPYPYNVDDTSPTHSKPDTFFVPMFAPDEPERITRTWTGEKTTYSYNSWLPDSWLPDELPQNYSSLKRQVYMPKYYPSGSISVWPGDGPNLSCTTRPITPLTDVTNTAGGKTVKDAIDDMLSGGATNVPQGIAWGWRIVSGREPFTQGRDDDEKGNDKVVIVLTDGANTYYTPEYFRKEDLAENESTYGAYGYAKDGRIFQGTSVGGYTDENYSQAMNKQMLKVCENAKNDGIVVMTVALDLSSTKRDERDQIEALTECASDSRSRTDDKGKPVKLFWNTRGDKLSETFKEIADELSNLRLVG